MVKTIVATSLEVEPLPVEGRKEGSWSGHACEIMQHPFGHDARMQLQLSRAEPRRTSQGNFGQMTAVFQKLTR